MDSIVSTPRSQNFSTTKDEALIEAATEGLFNVVKYLVEQGADVHAVGDLALSRASLGGHLEIVKYLVEEGGADLHAGHGVMSLPFAAGRGHFEVVKYLVEQGADIKAKGGLAFEWASRYNHVEILGYLLDQESALIEAKGGIKLLSPSQRQQLEKNFLANDAIIQKDGYPIDFAPVVKLFTPEANWTWLLTELSPDSIGFGLCDLGLGFPEVGYVDFAELEAIRGKLGLPIENDKGFVADKTLAQYARIARREERIIA